MCVCVCVCVRERERERERERDEFYATTDLHSLRQVAGLPDVQIWGKLYYVNDSAATMDHNWHIHEDKVCISLCGVCVCGGCVWWVCLNAHFDAIQ